MVPPAADAASAASHSQATHLRRRRGGRCDGGAGASMPGSVAGGVFISPVLQMPNLLGAHRRGHVTAPPPPNLPLSYRERLNRRPDARIGVL